MSAKVVQLWAITCDKCPAVFINPFPAPDKVTLPELAMIRLEAVMKGWKCETDDDSDLCPKHSGNPTREVTRTAGGGISVTQTMGTVHGDVVGLVIDSIGRPVDISDTGRGW